MITTLATSQNERQKRKRKKESNSLCIKLIEYFVLYLMFSKANFSLLMCENIDLDLFFEEGPSHVMNMIQLKALRL
jgi:hypothetical protein